MKEASEVRTEGRAVFYAMFWNEFRRTAIDCGYALALHGSMESDMDLIAVPWVDEPQPVETLVSRLSDCLGQTIWKDHHFKNAGAKPHGRQVYTLRIHGNWYIDLSIFLPQN